MGSETLLGDVVHAVGANLHLNPFALLAHEGVVEGLIAVCLGVGEPIAEALGVRGVYLRERGVDAVALVDLFGAILGREDDTDSQNIEDFCKTNVLVLHLAPNGIGALDARLDGIFHTYLVEGLTDGRRELVEDSVALGLRLRQLFLYLGIFFGMLVFETEVLQFGFNLVETKAVGQGREDVERFAGNLVLFAGQHTLERAHIVQAVGDFDEDDAHVVAHREQQLLEGFCLERSLVAEDAAGDFRHALHDVGHLRAEEIAQVIVGIVGIFFDVVEEGGTNTGAAQSDFFASNLRNGDGVQDIWLARASAYAFVRLLGEMECLGDNVHLAAMVACQIGIYEFLKGSVYELFVAYFLRRELRSSMCIVWHRIR